MDKKFNIQQGFSLIELSIVIIISGFLFAALATGYKNYFETSRIQKTQARFDTITQAMDRFFAAYGRYPCPARLDLGPDDVGFGVETRCDLAPPTSGISVAIGQVNRDSDPTTPSINSEIRIGAIPFVTLKEGAALFGDEKLYQSIVDIGSEDVIDTYNNKFTYALTEDQGTPAYIPYLGSVIVLDEHGKALSENAQGNHADYTIVSHGERDDGAWTYYGQQAGSGCAAAIPDNQEENCDGDDTYIASLRYDTGANDYDDTVFFRNWVSYFLWDVDNFEDQNSYNLNTGNVGVGIEDPVEKFHIFAGNAVADSAALNDASIYADEYCNFAPGNPGGDNCFRPSTIAGDQTTCDILDVSGDSGNLAVSAIRNNTVACDTIYDTVQNPPPCPAGEFVTGYAYDNNSGGSKVLTPTCTPL